MFQASQESIDRMKAVYEERGRTISDYEANEAVNNLCEFFKILHECDIRQKANKQLSGELSGQVAQIGIKAL